MRKQLKRAYETYSGTIDQMSRKQQIIFLTAVIAFWATVLFVFNATIWRTVETEDEQTSVYTYSYAEQHGHSITGTAGQCLDDCYYVIDETVIFGPYSGKPVLQIPIVGSEIVINTSEMSFAQDTIAGFGNGIFDYREEQRTQLDENTLVYAALARYEDGEIYVYVQFLQKVENLGGTSYVATELWSRDNDSLTDEEQRQIDTVHEITEQGMRDYYLYNPTALDEIVIGYAAAIEYRTDHLDLVGYCPERPILYDHK